MESRRPTTRSLASNNNPCPQGLRESIDLNGERKVEQFGVAAHREANGILSEIVTEEIERQKGGIHYLNRLTPVRLSNLMQRILVLFTRRLNIKYMRVFDGSITEDVISINIIKDFHEDDGSNHLAHHVYVVKVGDRDPILVFDKSKNTIFKDFVCGLTSTLYTYIENYNQRQTQCAELPVIMSKWPKVCNYSSEKDTNLRKYEHNSFTIESRESVSDDRTLTQYESEFDRTTDIDLRFDLSSVFEKIENSRGIEPFWDNVHNRFDVSVERVFTVHEATNINHRGWDKVKEEMGAALRVHTDEVGDILDIVEQRMKEYCQTVRSEGRVKPHVGRVNLGSLDGIQRLADSMMFDSDADNVD